MESFWFNTQSGNLEDGSAFPDNLNDPTVREVAIEYMDKGWVRVISSGAELTVEFTTPILGVLGALQMWLSLHLDNPVVHLCNIRTGESEDTTAEQIIQPPKIERHQRHLHFQEDPLNYTPEDICDAATLFEQHTAVYGYTLSQARARLSRSKLLVQTRPGDPWKPDITPSAQWVVRDALGAFQGKALLFSGRRLVDAAEFTSLGNRSVAFADADTWSGCTFSALGSSEDFDFLDASQVAEHFGFFDLVDVGWLFHTICRARGWNFLGVPRAWEAIQPSTSATLFLGRS